MTSDELVNARLYRESRCFICMETVPHNEGVCCKVPTDGVSLGFYYYLCAGCWSRVRSLYSSAARRHLDRLLPALRTMRPERVS
jgi:hypothetical protein